MDIERGDDRMPVRVTPEQLAEKWGRRLKGAIDDMRQGVERMTVAPGELAAKKADKWQSKLQEPDTKRKWMMRVSAVSLEDWKAQYINKGLPRVASGVDGAQGKMARFATALIAHQNTGLLVIEKMPDLTLEDSINRMGAWVRHMAKFEVRE